RYSQIGSYLIVSSRRATSAELDQAVRVAAVSDLVPAVVALLASVDLDHAVAARRAEAPAARCAAARPDPQVEAVVAHLAEAGVDRAVAAVRLEGAAGGAAAVVRAVARPVVAAEVAGLARRDHGVAAHVRALRGRAVEVGQGEAVLRL